MIQLVLRKSEWLDDWYVIEKADHNGKVWLEPLEHGFAFQHAARFSDADVEGSREEMLDIAQAILDRGQASHKRCAVRVNGDDVFFRSPRNSQREGHVTYNIAERLAHDIRSILINGEQRSISLEDDGQPVEVVDG